MKNRNDELALALALNVVTFVVVIFLAAVFGAMLD
jgi:hypothetical protein